MALAWRKVSNYPDYAYQVLRAFEAPTPQHFHAARQSGLAML